MRRTAATGSSPSTRGRGSRAASARDEAGSGRPVVAARRSRRVSIGAARLPTALPTGRTRSPPPQPESTGSEVCTSGSGFRNLRCTPSWVSDRVWRRQVPQRPGQAAGRRRGGAIGGRVGDCRHGPPRRRGHQHPHPGRGAAGPRRSGWPRPTSASRGRISGGPCSRPSARCAPRAASWPGPSGSSPDQPQPQPSPARRPAPAPPFMSANRALGGRQRGHERPLRGAQRGAGRAQRGG